MVMKKAKARSSFFLGSIFPSGPTLPLHPVNDGTNSELFLDLTGWILNSCCSNKFIISMRRLSSFSLASGITIKSFNLRSPLRLRTSFAFLRYWIFLPLSVHTPASGLQLSFKESALSICCMTDPWKALTWPVFLSPMYIIFAFFSHGCVRMARIKSINFWHSFVNSN